MISIDHILKSLEAGSVKRVCTDLKEQSAKYQEKAEYFKAFKDGDERARLYESLAHTAFTLANSITNQLNETPEPQADGDTRE